MESYFHSTFFSMAGRMLKPLLPASCQDHNFFQKSRFSRELLGESAVCQSGGMGGRWCCRVRDAGVYLSLHCSPALPFFTLWYITELWENKKAQGKWKREE